MKYFYLITFFILVSCVKYENTKVTKLIDHIKRVSTAHSVAVMENNLEGLSFEDSNQFQNYNKLIEKLNEKKYLDEALHFHEELKIDEINKDYWGIEMKLETISHNEQKAEYQIISAGPNMKFGDRDDIIRRYTVRFGPR
jgi:uncharacterized protein YoxC